MLRLNYLFSHTGAVTRRYTITALSLVVLL